MASDESEGIERVAKSWPRRSSNRNWRFGRPVSGRGLLALWRPVPVVTNLPRFISGGGVLSRQDHHCPRLVGIGENGSDGIACPCPNRETVVRIDDRSPDSDFYIIFRITLLILVGIISEFKIGDPKKDSPGFETGTTHNNEVVSVWKSSRLKRFWRETRLINDDEQHYSADQVRLPASTARIVVATQTLNIRTASGEADAPQHIMSGGIIGERQAMQTGF